MDYYLQEYTLMNNYNLFIGDAAFIPFPNNTFDSIITDLPYGHSTIIRGDNIDSLYTNSLLEIYRVLKKNKLAVIVSSSDINIKLRNINFLIFRVYKQRIHKSLTRFITVIKKN